MPQAHGRHTARLVLTWGSLALVASLLLSLAGWLAAEPGQTAVLHRGFDGEPNRVGPVTELLVVFPIITVATFALMVVIARWGHVLRYDDQPLPEPKILAGFLVGTTALLPALQAVILADAYELIRWDLTQTILELVISIPLLALGIALLHPRTAPKLADLVNLPIAKSHPGRAAVVQAAGRYLAALGGIGLAAGLIGPAWLFFMVIGPGATIGAIGLLAYTLTVQSRTSGTGG